MAALNYYTITPCCPELGTPLLDFRIPGGTLASGVYVYDGADTPLNNGIIFNTDNCYTIINHGTSSGILPIAPIAADFSIVGPDGCLDLKCEACDPALPVACEIYACCDATNIITLNISDATISTDGVYSYDGSIPTEFGGFTFEPGACYKITFVGSSIETTGPLLDDFLFQGSSCNTTESCPSCPTVDQYLRYESCCGTTVLNFRPYSTSEYFEGVYEYLSTPVNGLENICYSLTIQDVGVAPINNSTDYGALPEAPPFIEGLTFDTKSDTNTDCADFVLDCATCKKICYTLYNCEGGSINTTVDLSDYVDTFIAIYNIDGPIDGTWYVLINSDTCNNAIEDIQVDDFTPLPCECRCFEITGIATSITYINCDGDLTTKASPSKFCSFTYPFVTGTVGEYEIIEGGPCVDNVCPIVCYKLTNCDTGEIIYSTLQSLSQYVNTTSVVTLSGYEGCWTVTESVVNGCDCITVTIETASGIAEYTANNIGTYNGWGVWQFTVDADTFYIWNSSVNPLAYGWKISINAYGASPGASYTTSKLLSDCPEAESDGTLTGWVLQAAIPWINVITEVCVPICDCPVNVIVLQTFDTCGDCLPIIAYKLTSCENSSDIKYTYDDLSLYVDQVVKTDCGCYLVKLIDFQPPSLSTIIIITLFTTCVECLRQYYILEDCNEIEDPIYTYTDLSIYLGEVIKIKGCDTCWTPAEVDIPINPGVVTVDASFIDCPACAPVLPCLCQTATLINPCVRYEITIPTIFEGTITYINCDGETVITEILPHKEPLDINFCGPQNQVFDLPFIIIEDSSCNILSWIDCDGNTVNGGRGGIGPNESSPKTCVKKWLMPEGQYEYRVYGECIETEDLFWVCPITTPKRKVKPGYSTPTCDIEKYEKITCRASEIYYKQVMRLRYGISNCCPEDEEKWLIKKELIDLQALVDPDYICTPVTSCCGQTLTSCGCGCNQTLKTCNS